MSLALHVTQFNFHAQLIFILTCNLFIHMIDEITFFKRSQATKNFMIY